MFCEQIIFKTIFKWIYDNVLGTKYFSFGEHLETFKGSQFYEGWWDDSPENLTISAQQDLALFYQTYDFLRIQSEEYLTETCQVSSLGALTE